MNNIKTILVIGASGNQGNAVATNLLSDGWAVRAMTRNPEQPSIQALKEMGASVVEADMDDEQSLSDAMEDVYGVYSVQSFDNNDPEKEIRQGKRVADLAKKASVSHFVYSSAAGAERYDGAQNFATKWQIEEHIRSLDLPSTILRPTFFMDNFEGFAKGQDGKVVIQGFMDLEIKLQMIAVQDIGAFANIAFKNPEQHIGEAIEIAGEEKTLTEISKKISKAFDAPCEIVDSREKFQKMMKMFEWFEFGGYEANISKLREINPQLLDFEAWVKHSGWNPLK